MLRRCSVLLMVLCLLLGCVAPAGASGLSKATQYETALQEVRNYLDGEDIMSLDAVCNLLESLQGYKQSADFCNYACVLRDVDKDDFSRVYVWIGRLKKNPDFCAYLTENGYNSVEELESYARGRQAESEGDIETALAYYRQCQSMRGVSWRISQLEDAELERMYQQAQEAYASGTADGAAKACELFAELAELVYKDSEEMAAKARSLSASAGTPSPTPTATPTAPPTATPVSTPKWVDGTQTAGDFQIDTFADGSCTITGYTGTAKNVTIPESLAGYRVAGIGDGAFAYHAIEAIVIPEGVLTIGMEAFYACDVTEVHIPASVTTICEGAFWGCLSLKKISVDAANQWYYAEDGVLFSRDGVLVAFPANADVTAYEIPEGVSRIASYAFCASQNLTSVQIPDTVTEIGDLSFFNCIGIERLAIPASVQEIGDRAFANMELFDNSKTTLEVVQGSYAARYAVNNGYPYLVTATGSSRAAAQAEDSIEASVSGRGDSRIITVKASGSWTAKANVPWIMLNQVSGSGNISISAKLEANPSAESSRSGNVIFTCGSKTATVTITQQKGEVQLSASVSGSGSTRTISVVSNGSWTAKTDAAWISLSRQYGSGNGQIAVTLAQNPQSSERSGMVTLKSGDKTVTVVITQEAAPAAASGSTQEVVLEGMAGVSGSAWLQAGTKITDEFRAALRPGTAVEISFTASSGCIWLVFPDSAAGWKQVSMMTARTNAARDKAWITYEEIAAVLGNDTSKWGSKLQCESSSAWTVKSVRVVPASAME